MKVLVYFSVKTIRKLAEIFRVRQDAFNRPYVLKASVKKYQEIDTNEEITGMLQLSRLFSMVLIKTNSKHKTRHKG